MATARYISIGVMLTKIHGLVGTKYLTDWEDDFVQSVWERSEDGKKTSSLTEKQVAVIERIHAKFFA